MLPTSHQLSRSVLQTTDNCIYSSLIMFVSHMECNHQITRLNAEIICKYVSVYIILLTVLCLLVQFNMKHTCWYWTSVGYK